MNGNFRQKNIRGKWRADNVQGSGFRFTRSVFQNLDSLLPYQKAKSKYAIVGDSLVIYSNGIRNTSTSKIEMLHRDTMITSDSFGKTIYIKVK